MCIYYICHIYIFKQLTLYLELFIYFLLLGLVFGLSNRCPIRLLDYWPRIWFLDPEIHAVFGSRISFGICIPNTIRIRLDFCRRWLYTAALYRKYSVLDILTKILTGTELRLR